MALAAVAIQKLRLELRNEIALADDSAELQRLQFEIDELADRVDALEKRPPQILRSVGGGGGGGGAAPAPVVPVVPVSPKAFAALVGDGASTTISVTHGLGTLDVIAQVYDPATGATVDCDTVRDTPDTVSFGFAPVAPSTNQYRVLIQALA